MNKMVVLFFCLFLSCAVKGDCNVTIDSLPEAKVSLEAIEDNDRGVELLVKYRENMDSLRLAVDFFDQAIEVDSSYLLAYVNKAQVLCVMGEAKKAIATMDIVCGMKPNDRTYLFAKGLYQDVAGDKDLAQNSYKQSLAVYDRLIREYPDSVALCVNKYFTLLFANVPSRQVVDSINFYKSKLPNNSAWRMYDFNAFSKEDFLNNMTK